MDVSKIKILNKVGSKEIVVPLSTNWDLSNRGDAITDEEKPIIKKIIGKPPNYELQRFSREKVGISTAQVYQFNFYNSETTIWEPTYLNNFQESLVRYTRGSFAKSFFKLDLYDTSDPKKQKIYLSIILPTSESSELSSAGTSNCKSIVFSRVLNYDSNGLISAPEYINGRINFTDCCGVFQSILANLSVLYGCVDTSQPVWFSATRLKDPPTPFTIPIYLNGESDNNYYDATDNGICECEPDIIPPAQPPNLTYPNFYLDHVGNKEGYYIYWYQDEKLINLNTFYMTAKFFDASTGRYIRFTTNPLTQTKIPNDDLYYRVILDYPNKLYKITNLTDTVLISDVNWYEYVNPKIT
jgi:hypothetical protein